MTTGQEPKVPDGPVGERIDRPERPEKADERDRDKDKDSQKRPGGRRPYEELLEENRALGERVNELLVAIAPLAQVPDDPAKPDEDVLYTLVRSNRQTKILCGDIRRARAAMGIP